MLFLLFNTIFFLQQRETIIESHKWSKSRKQMMLEYPLPVGTKQLLQVRNPKRGDQNVLRLRELEDYW